MNNVTIFLRKGDQMPFGWIIVIIRKINKSKDAEKFNGYQSEALLNYFPILDLYNIS